MDEYQEGDLVYIVVDSGFYSRGTCDRCSIKNSCDVMSEKVVDCINFNGQQTFNEY